MKLPTLYKRTKTGAITQWSIEALNGATRTIHGQVGGKIQTSEWYKCETTNKGRANQRNPQEQAVFEAEAEWKKRKEKNYFESPDEVDNIVFREPMRAKKWEDENKGKKSVKFPVFVQPKLDGMRCVLMLENGKVVAKSRGNKYWVTVPHILKAVEPIFDVFKGLMMDGELYCDKYAKDFNMISKLIKRTKPSAEDLKKSEEHIRFHWYDVCDEDSIFSDRNLFIKEMFEVYSDELKDAAVYVETYKANTLEELKDFHGQFLSESYEGTIVRQDWPYEFTRTAGVLKMKDFIDEEFLIRGIEEGGGNKTGLAVKCILEFRDGRLFPSTIKAPFDVLKEIWDNKDEYIDKKYATCKYFELTPEKEDGGGGIPKFSNCDRFRDAPSVD